MDEEIIWSIVFVVALVVGVVKLRVCSVVSLSTRIIKRMPGGSYTSYEGVSQRIDGELVDWVCFESVEEFVFVGNLYQCCLILFCLSAVGVDRRRFNRDRCRATVEIFLLQIST